MRTLSLRPLWLCVPALIALFADISLASAAATTTPYQENKNCPSDTTTNCTLDFKPVPAGERLEISDATCYFLATPSTARPALVVLDVADRRKTISSQYLTPVLVASNATGAGGALTDQVFMFATAGQKFAISITGTGDTTQLLAGCSISGHMVATT